MNVFPKTASSWLAGLTVMATAPWLSAAPFLDETSYQKEILPFFQKYCVECHGPDEQESGLRLDTLSIDMHDQEAAQYWLEVMDLLNLEEMPPAKSPQPTTEERVRVANWIASETGRVQKMAHSTGGRILLRRLTRSEYENTVRDLLGVTFEPGRTPVDLLPPDGQLEGFTKVSKALLLDPSLMATYLDVAEEVVDRALTLGPPPVPTVRTRLEYEEFYEGDQSRLRIVTDDGAISYGDGYRTFGELKHPFGGKMIPVPGKYAVRWRAGAEPGPDGKPVYIKVYRQSDGVVWQGQLDATLEDPAVYEAIREFDPVGGELKIEMSDPLSVGIVNRHQGRRSDVRDELIKAGKAREGAQMTAEMKLEGIYGMGRLDPEKREIDHHKKIFVDYIEIEGPLYEQWPPESIDKIFFAGTDPENFTNEYAKAIIERLLPRAYRRPVANDEIKTIYDLYLAEREMGSDWLRGLQTALSGMLVAPQFLYLAEPGEEKKPRRLRPYELASRLSYFIWSTMPDEELFKLAENGKLLHPKVLDEQVERMLRDPKAENLVNGFAAQWLKAEDFDRFEPDNKLYPKFYEPQFAQINEDLNREPLEFFRELLVNNGDARAMLDSDWLVINKRLAEYYGLPSKGLENDKFVKVKLPADSPRGGLLGMGAVHKWGSDGNRTKPVDRGKYVLEVLFNDPPNPPPPNVGEVEPNVKGKKLTVRERLEQHRQIPSCAACHSGLDPYGLALENFNVIGQWRDQQDGEGQNMWRDDAPPIDASGELPNGKTFANLEEFKELMQAQSDRFARGLSEKLFIYALGRTVEPSDRKTIETLVRQLENNDYQLSSLIKGLVRSEPFLTK